MSKLGVILIAAVLIIVSASSFARRHKPPGGGGGGGSASPVITYGTPSPSVPDTTTPGTTATTVSITMSDASPFTGTVALSGTYGDDNGTCALKGSGASYNLNIGQIAHAPSESVTSAEGTFTFDTPPVGADYGIKLNGTLTSGQGDPMISVRGAAGGIVYALYNAGGHWYQRSPYPSPGWVDAGTTEPTALPPGSSTQHCTVQAVQGATTNANIAIAVTGSGGIPAPAAAAGFTTQITNVDFTTVSGSWPASNIVNCGASDSVPGNPSTWHFYHMDGTSSTQLPCGNTTLVTDPLNGNQALLQTVAPGQSISPDPSQTFSYPTTYPIAAGRGSVPWMPNEYFVKTTWRLDCNTRYQQPNAPGCTEIIGAGNPFAGIDPWSSGSQGVDHIDNNDAEDWLSSSLQPGWCTHIDKWTGGGGPGFYLSAGACPWFAEFTTAYHTIAALYTSDESTGMAVCAWLDPDPTYTTGFLGCASGSLDSPTQYTDRGHTHMLETVCHANGGSCSVYTQSMWISNYQIWGCANLGTSSGCPGTIVSHWP